RRTQRAAFGRNFASFATFCEILNSAVVSLHGWLKVAEFGTALQLS
ncbi:MAG: hypothetical protein ACI856_002906, partial [Kiritimatiellia bacterium]